MLKMLNKKNIILVVFAVALAVVLLWMAMPLRILSVRSKLLLVEIAKTQEQRQQGLQNRTILKKNRGMLFVFKEEAFHSFWMKDTYLPLDIAFIDSNHRIVDIQQMIPLDTRLRYKPVKAAKYALEVNAGWMEGNNIQVNEKVFFWSGPLPAK